MKQLIISLACLILLIGCHEKVATFDEEIMDGYVNIDGLDYMINKTIIESFEYDTKGNILSTNIDLDGNQDNLIEYIYEDNLLIKTNMYVNQKLTSYRLFKYKNNKLVRNEFYSGDVIQYTDITFEDNLRKSRVTDSKYGLVNIIIDEFNEDGIIIKREHEDRSSLSSDNGIQIITGELHEISKSGLLVSEFFYTNNLLSKRKTTQNDLILSNTYYEYNNFGDEIVAYGLRYNDESTFLVVSLFEYEYNQDGSQKKKIEYRIYDEIDEKAIRLYE